MIDEWAVAPPTTTLRSGRRITIRPLAEDDRAALLAFGEALPHDDWRYLEDDLRNPDIIARLVNAHAAENWRQFVAAADGAIAGYSAVRRLPGRSNHVADLRLIVSAGWRREGLGTALAQTLFSAARDLGAAKLIAELLETQVAGRGLLERLGFRIEGTLSAHAHDRYGRRHNLLILAYHL